MVSALIRAGADVNALDRWKLSPLSSAIAHRHHAIVSTLTEAGAVLNQSAAATFLCEAARWVVLPRLGYARLPCDSSIPTRQPLLYLRTEQAEIIVVSNDLHALLERVVRTHMTPWKDRIVHIFAGVLPTPAWHISFPCALVFSGHFAELPG